LFIQFQKHLYQQVAAWIKCISTITYCFNFYIYLLTILFLGNNATQYLGFNLCKCLYTILRMR
jgi:hypothetical protein